MPAACSGQPGPVTRSRNSGSVGFTGDMSAAHFPPLQEVRPPCEAPDTFPWLLVVVVGVVRGGGGGGSTEQQVRNTEASGSSLCCGHFVPKYKNQVGVLRFPHSPRRWGGSQPQSGEPATRGWKWPPRPACALSTTHVRTVAYYRSSTY
jgi:hypothetical protein